MKINPMLDAAASLGDRVLARGDGRQMYAVRLARGAADIRDAQAMRFIVFNIELNEGLEKSYATCLDADPFDEVCDHLLVENVQTREIVGTYRLQTGSKAALNRGYYSSQEFDFSPYEPLRSELIELGRACVHRDHRNLTVLGLLWKGIAAYSRQKGARYLIGCSSLTSQDPVAGASMYAELSRKYLVRHEFQTQPLADWACPLDRLAETPPKVPKLLAAYLSIGARICGPPAIDRDFKTIDFLTFMDLKSLPDRIIERYLS